MLILGIETSCDETGIALLEADFDVADTPRFKVISHALNSQTKVHEKYGGVFPMMAKREHGRNLVPLLEKMLEETGFGISNNQFPISKQFSKTQIQNLKKILNRETELLPQFLESLPTLEKPPLDAIAVTVGPGLEPCLWTGINFAKALASVWNVPIVPTNHMEGHIASVLLNGSENPNNQTPNSKRVEFPAIAFLISGGHTELVLMKNWGEYEIIGRTKDDAVGEAFDKGARILGLPYPGGPSLSALAEVARIDANLTQTNADKFRLPRPMIYSKDLDFSFSGLKTALLYTVKKIGELTPEIKKGLALEFENAIVEVLSAKTKKALEKYPVKSLIVGGGVIANKTVRNAMSKVAEEFGVEFRLPTQTLSTDNAIMIAIVGAINFHSGKRAHPDLIKANGNLVLS